jgi:nitrite reductase (NADH) large subunit
MSLDTHVVEFAPRLMAVQVDDLGGRVLRTKNEELGVNVHTQKNTLRIVDGESATHRMEFADGSFLEADMIVFSAGIRPRDELAKAAGLALGPRGGIAIDDACLASDPHIYAIGECASWGGQTFGLVAPGYEMARIVARALIGQEAAFAGADMSTKLKLMGVDVASIGDAHGNTPGSRSFQFTDERKQVYKKIVVSDCGKKLLGAVLIGDAAEYGSLLQMMLNDMELPEAPEFLILPQLEGGARPALGVDALPASAQVCSCNAVTKGVIADAVLGGACDIGAIKSCTNAGTSCGGCVPLVTQIMKSEMAKAGMAVNNHLCEHFAYSRQEIYHLVRVGQIKTFDDLLHKHGKGLGCDICKPTAASIFASCWNEFVLKKDLAGLQDSNDYFLGNIQKDGTYSVVPRMWGGCTTADELRRIADAVDKYRIPTVKVTGGQRIDLLGVKKEDLQDVWRDIGMPSGFAYGKSLRTVKTCVGSEWCRFGTQDSTRMGQDLERALWAMYSPHKVKLAVSGCPRNCAEAGIKDVGVIGVDSGWEIYVGGNGGIKTEVAQFLVKLKTAEEVMQYTGAFLQLYRLEGWYLERTAHYLARVGLDHVKQRVVDDAPGRQALWEQLQFALDGAPDPWFESVRAAVDVRQFHPLTPAPLAAGVL